jgi:DHA3 family macrolide efflux protein-like MFS transporter
LHVHHNRDVYRVAAARFIGRLGGEAAFFVGVWGLAAYRFQATASELAVLMLVLGVSSMVGAAVGGVLIDRFGPQRVLVGAEIAYVPVALSLTFASSLATLTPLVGLFGLIGAPIMTATSAFAPYLVTGSHELERTNALIETAGSASFILGPALGALIASTISLDAVFVADALLTVIAVLIVARVSTPPRHAETDRHPLSEFVYGLKETYRIRSVRYYVLVGTVIWLGFGAFSALEPLFYRDAVGTGVEMIGWMNSIFGIGIMIGALALTRLPDRVLSARGLAIGAALVGAGTVLYVGSTELPRIAFGALVWGAMIGAVEPLLRTLMHMDAPEEIVGRVMGTAQVHRSAGELLPLAFAPVLAANFGVQAVLIGGGLLVSVIALGSFAEASAIDRAAGGSRRAARVERLTPADEPISPNP